MSFSRIHTDLLVVDLSDAAQTYERAADGPSADAEHEAGRELAEAALAVCEAYDSAWGAVTISDAAVLGRLVRAAWEHQLVGWLTAGGGLMWGTARSIGDERGNPADDSADLRNCFLRVTTLFGKDVYLPVPQVVDDAKAGRLVLNYNQHPEAHGPGVWCGGCPKMAPLTPPTPMALATSEER